MLRIAILVVSTGLLAGCGPLVGHMVSRDHEEDLSAVDYALPLDRLEREVRAVYQDFRIEVTDSKRTESEIVIEGKAPDDLGVKARLRQLRGDLVRVTFLGGSFFGTMLNRTDAIKRELDLKSALQQRLHEHMVGG